VQGLAELKGDAEAERALAAASQSDPFWAVRQEAVKALGKRNGDEARQALLRAAREDAKSFVRREALAALAAYSHDDTRAALREAIDKDSSYFAVAEALKALAKVDRDACRPVLVAALARDSERDVILKAAIDGLVELKDTSAAEPLAKMLDQPLSPTRRGAVIAGLARLRPDDSASLERLHGQLANERTSVRRAAVEALAKAGSLASIDKLQELRGEEEVPSMLSAIDQSLEELRKRLSDGDALRSEVEKLRQQNQRLQERLEKLENAGR
jgi:aminopeptidase N